MKNPAENDLKKATILVVEDDDRVRSAACGILGLAGYQVLEARNSEDAMESGQRSNQIQILFADVTLPGKNGFQLAACLRRQLPHLKVLLASGYPEFSKVPSSDQNRDFFHLAKPYSGGLLLQRVNAMVENR
jgi:DNA-binding NtrC family response regulator